MRFTRAISGASTSISSAAHSLLGSFLAAAALALVLPRTAVVDVERAAWVREILANLRGPDLDAYLATQLNHPV